MGVKYILTDETIIVNGHTLHRIKAARDFGTVVAGQLGGFIEKEENLSHEGNAWVGGDACVYENAYVCGDTYVCDNAKVFGCAKICNNAEVYGEAHIYGHACVFDYTKVYAHARVRDFAKVCNYASVDGYAWACGNAVICGSARVCDNAEISGRAEVCDSTTVYNNAEVSGCAKVCNSAKVYGNARVHGNARICDNATVSGDANIYDNVKVCDEAKVLDRAVVCGNVHISNSTRICGDAHCITDITFRIKESIRVQTGLLPVGNEVIAYKQVRKDLTSFYDPNFQYEVGKIVEAENPDESNKSCAPGLHFSNANYWNNKEDVANSTFLIARINLDDIITVQDGKIRCRKALIIGSYNIG